MSSIVEGSRIATFNFYRSNPVEIFVTTWEENQLPEMIKNAKEGKNPIVVLSGSIVDLRNVTCVTFKDHVLYSNSI